MYINQKGNMIAAGKVSRDVEFKHVGQKNTPLTQFSIKAGEKPAKDGERPEAIWLTVKCWYDLAAAAQSIRKGDYVFVAGKFSSRPYQASGGEQRVSNEISAEYFNVLAGSDPKPAPPNVLADADEFQEMDDEDDDGDVPF